jgi:hydrogenase maturation factor
MHKFVQKPIELHLLCESQNFPDLNSFLHAINPDNPYDYQTVESYLFGNSLTKLVPKNILIKQYKIWARDGVAEFNNRLLPPHVYLTHFTQVAIIAAADPGDPIAKINACAIFPAKVISIDGPKIGVIRNRYPKFDEVEQRVNVSRGEIINVGDTVAIHLGSIFTKITSEQFNNLEGWNRKVAENI